MTARWTSEAPAYQGRFVEFGEVDAYPRPVWPSRLKIVVGAAEPGHLVDADAARRYADLGVDRLLLYPQPLEDPAEAARFLERHADLPR